MNVNDPVRIYEGEWFSEGHITSIAAEGITVDFMDWVQLFQPTDLRIDFIFFQEILVVVCGGKIISDYR